MKTLIITLMVFFSTTLAFSQATFKIIPNEPNQLLEKLIKDRGQNKNSDGLYWTKEIIEYDFYETEDSILRKINLDLMLSLREISKSPVIVPKKERDSIYRIVAFNKVRLTEIDSIKDSLFNIYVKEYLATKKTHYFDFGTKKASALYDIIYGENSTGFRALSNTSLQFGENSASLSAELVEARIGAFKFSLSTLVSKSSQQDSLIAKEEEAYQRLVNNGGNVVLNAEYPLIYAHSSNNKFNFLATMNFSGAADIPQFGTTTTDWAGHTSFGPKIYAEVSTNKNEITFFATLNLYKYIGNSYFKTNLGTDKSNFFFGQPTLGLIFLKNFKISFTLPPFTSQENLKNKNTIVGGQVLM